MPRRSRRYSVTMSDFNNSSASEETSRDGTNGGVPAGGTAGNDNLESQWSEFLSEHADDVSALDASRTAKRFEKEAAKQDRLRHERQRKEAERQFKQMAQSEQGQGPRDFETSILDDAPDDHFTPPTDPDASMDHYTRVYLMLLVSGLVLVVLGFVFPRLSAAFESTGGMLLLIGILALIMRKR